MSFLYGSAPPAALGRKGTRGLVSKNGSLSSRAYADCRLNEPENEASFARSVHIQLKHAKIMSDAPTQSCWPPAEIQARITRDAHG